MNRYREENGLNPLILSENLNNSSIKHLNYLKVKKIISHRGENNSYVRQRALDAGSTALVFGEIIGYSTSQELLFKKWIESPTHNSVLLDPGWTTIGIAYESDKGFCIGVINFSNGNIYSTSLERVDGKIIFKGRFITTPKFETGLVIESQAIKNNEFILELKSQNRGGILYIYNEKNKVTDRVDIFF